MVRAHTRQLRIVAALVCTLFAGAARAQTEDAEARALFAKGQAFYAHQDFSNALTAFLSAYEKKPLPLLLFNAAQSARRSGKFADALDLYRRYILTEPQAAERPQCERYIRELSAYEVAHTPPAATPTPTPTPTPDEPRVAPLDTTSTLVASPPPAPPPRHTGLIVGVTVGAIVVVGGAIALGLVFGLHPHGPSGSLGTFEPFK